MENRYSHDLELMPKELTLLYEILNTNEDSSQLNRNELLIGIHWDQFLQLAMHHRVYPLIYSKIKNIDNKGIPPYVIETLYKEYKKNTFEMLKLSGEMEQVSKLFSENNILLLFLKGPVIAEDIYGDISLRTSRDLDILIQSNKLEKAEEVLLGVGYERKEVPTPFWKLRFHHVTFFHPKKRICLELHWRLHPHSIYEPCFDELWERKRVSTLTSFPTYYLGKEDLFLYLVAHGGRHGWFRLRWLKDIDQILNKKMTSNGNILLKKKFYHLDGQRYYLGQALILVSELFHTPINKEMKKLTISNGSRKLAKRTILYINRRAHLNFSMSEDELNKNHNRYLFTIKSNLEKFIFIMKLFYPNPKDAEALTLPRSLRFLYIPFRPFLWAWRKTMKSKY
ncbi:nucleotidyltransferase family protein [Peribacillus simplex]|uniref:nucleotidyltransferase domain-containing protein n=1 Tax=Peribacillus simplex TaxID=1478 RepID=UPI002989F208|nr:nucleotidyltransferase family protein [Peribacillus simplex]MBX9954122.1 nucleotidyltransferase family protein [Peribacillus simplex]